MSKRSRSAWTLALEKQAEPLKATPKRVYRSGWEEDYANVLAQRKINGEIRDWGYERVRLVLPGGITYRVDFDVHPKDERLIVELHEVKGRLREPARIKMRQAFVLFPNFRWFIVRGDMRPQQILGLNDITRIARQ